MPALNVRYVPAIFERPGLLQPLVQLAAVESIGIIFFQRGIVLVDGQSPTGWTAGFTAASQAMGGNAVVLPVAGDTVPAPVAALVEETDATVVCSLALELDACG